MKFSFIALIISLSSLLTGQIDDTISFKIEEITISENRISLPFSDVSRSIEIIDQQQIQSIHATNVNEILQIIGGVDVRQRGVMGVQADLSIRGGTFEQALVMINGIKMLDPQTGHHIMNLPLTLEDIERIEVLKGPGARVFGQNAFAGAINIITKTSSDFHLTAGITYGANSLLSTFASINLPTANYQQKLSASYDHSAGYRSNTDFDIYNLFYQGQATLGKGSLDVIGGFTSRNFGANGFYGSESFVDQYERTRTSILSVSYTEHIGKWKIAPRISWRRNFDNWRFLRQDPDFFQNIHTTNVIVGEINTSKTHNLGILGVGFEYNIIDLNSSNLGDRNRTQYGIHLENRFLFDNDRIDVTPGLYVQNISDFGTKFYPGLDIGFRIDRKWKLFTNAGITSRIPSFTDLYYEDRGNIGNPDLIDESAFTFELGLKYKNPSILFQLSYFRRKASDLIDWFKVNPEDKWMPDNFGVATYNGIDLGSTFFLSSNNKQSVLQSLRINYLYLNASLGDVEFALSRNALENLKHQLILNPQFKFSDHVWFHFVLKYNNRVSLDNYAVADANIQYKYSNFTFSLKASNLFNSTYRETNLVPMPGRWISGGVRYRM